MSDIRGSATPGRRDDPWPALRRRTPARVALGRAGTSLPTAEVLRFAADHAEARDAVLSEADLDAVAAALAPLGRPVLRVQSAAADRAAYVRFPDRGRTLPAAERDALAAAAPAERPDVVLLIGDGLSAAALRHAPPLASLLLAELARPPAVAVGPIVLVRHARVAIQDPVGHALGARAAAILLGERPGLGSADSLGAYVVHGPRPGRTDADRNCVSNIRPAGLPLAAAAGAVAYLIRQSLARGISGVGLKDDRGEDPECGRASLSTSHQ